MSWRCDVCGQTDRDDGMCGCERRKLYTEELEDRCERYEEALTFALEYYRTTLLDPEHPVSLKAEAALKKDSVPNLVKTKE